MQAAIKCQTLASNVFPKTWVSSPWQTYKKLLLLNSYMANWHLLAAAV